MDDRLYPSQDPGVAPERVSAAALPFGLCPRCHQPVVLQHYWKNNWATCPDCKLLLGCVGYGIFSSEGMIWESPAEMKTQLGIADWRDRFDHLEPWQPEPDIPDWRVFYELVAEHLQRYAVAAPIYDVGAPYVDPGELC